MYCSLANSVTCLRGCAHAGRQDQHGPVVDRHLDMSLKIALLRRAQELVKPDLLGAVHLGQHADFIRLAAAHKQCWIRSFALAGQARHGCKPAV